MPANRQGNSNFFNYGSLFDSTNQRLTALNNNAVEKAKPSRESAVASATGQPAATNSAPAKATAAPSANTSTDFIGLCAAMNKYEQQLVTEGTVDFANKYTVKFIPASLASSTIALPGGVDKTKTPMQNGDTAKDKVDPNTNKVDNKGLNRSITQGTQIVQFIELVMRNSSYITDQQTHIIDPVTGNAKPSNSTSKNDTTTWFKISVSATPIGSKMDTKRNDYAYDMVYIITPYGINQSESQFFPQAQFRGVHKVYDYWFTGLNTQVLNYEQEYSALYFDVISGKTPVNNNNSALANQVAQPWQNSKVPTTASGQSSQGADNGANNPASTLADYLYSQADQSKIMLKILGDPAWIQQGEIVGAGGLNFNFQGFYPDGTINTDAQQAVFAVNWNAPADYNLNTGLVDVNKAATSGLNNNLSTSQPQQSAAYTAIELKSFFNHGRFEQELHGTLLTNLNQKQLSNAASNGRQAPSATGTARDANVQDSAAGTVVPVDNTPTPTSTDSNPEITNPPAQPAAPAKPPTTYTGSGVPQGPVQPVPLTADMANQLSFGPLFSVFSGKSQRTIAAENDAARQTMAAKDQ